MSELVQSLLAGLVLAAVIGTGLAGLVLLKARRHPDGLRGSLEAWFRRPPRSPAPAGKKHYYIPYWLSR